MAEADRPISQSDAASESLGIKAPLQLPTGLGQSFLKPLGLRSLSVLRPIAVHPLMDDFDFQEISTPDLQLSSLAEFEPGNEDAGSDRSIRHQSPHPPQPLSRKAHPGTSLPGAVQGVVQFFKSVLGQKNVPIDVPIVDKTTAPKPLVSPEFDSGNIQDSELQEMALGNSLENSSIANLATVQLRQNEQETLPIREPSESEINLTQPIDSEQRNAEPISFSDVQQQSTAQSRRPTQPDSPTPIAPFQQPGLSHERSLDPDQRGDNSISLAQPTAYQEELILQTQDQSIDPILTLSNSIAPSDIPQPHSANLSAPSPLLPSDSAIVPAIGSAPAIVPVSSALPAIQLKEELGNTALNRPLNPPQVGDFEEVDILSRVGDSGSGSFEHQVESAEVHRVQRSADSDLEQPLGLDLELKIEHSSEKLSDSNPLLKSSQQSLNSVQSAEASLSEIQQQVENASIADASIANARVITPTEQIPLASPVSENQESIAKNPQTIPSESIENPEVQLSVESHSQPSKSDPETSEENLIPPAFSPEIQRQLEHTHDRSMSVSISETSTADVGSDNIPIPAERVDVFLKPLTLVSESVQIESKPIDAVNHSFETQSLSSPESLIDQPEVNNSFSKDSATGNSFKLDHPGSEAYRSPVDSASNHTPINHPNSSTPEDFELVAEDAQIVAAESDAIVPSPELSPVTDRQQIINSPIAPPIPHHQAPPVFKVPLIKGDLGGSHPEIPTKTPETDSEVSSTGASVLYPQPIQRNGEDPGEDSVEQSSAVLDNAPNRPLNPPILGDFESLGNSLEGVDSRLDTNNTEESTQQKLLASGDIALNLSSEEVTPSLPTSFPPESFGSDSEHSTLIHSSHPGSDIQHLVESGFDVPPQRIAEVTEPSDAQIVAAESDAIAPSPELSPVTDHHQVINSPIAPPIPHHQAPPVFKVPLIKGDLGGSHPEIPTKTPETDSEVSSTGASVLYPQPIQRNREEPVEEPTEQSSAVLNNAPNRPLNPPILGDFEALGSSLEGVDSRLDTNIAEESTQQKLLASDDLALNLSEEITSSLSTSFSPESFDSDSDNSDSEYSTSIHLSHPGSDIQNFVESGFDVSPQRIADVPIAPSTSINSAATQTNDPIVGEIYHSENSSPIAGSDSTDLDSTPIEATLSDRPTLQSDTPNLSIPFPPTSFHPSLKSSQPFNISHPGSNIQRLSETDRNAPDSHLNAQDIQVDSPNSTSQFIEPHQPGFNPQEITDTPSIAQSDNSIQSPSPVREGFGERSTPSHQTPDLTPKPSSAKEGEPELLTSIQSKSSEHPGSVNAAAFQGSPDPQFDRKDHSSQYSESSSESSSEQYSESSSKQYSEQYSKSSSESSSEQYSESSSEQYSESSSEEYSEPSSEIFSETFSNPLQKSSSGQFPTPSPESTSPNRHSPQARSIPSSYDSTPNGRSNPQISAPSDSSISGNLPPAPHPVDSHLHEFTNDSAAPLSAAQRDFVQEEAASVPESSASLPQLPKVLQDLTVLKPLAQRSPADFLTRSSLKAKLENALSPKPVTEPIALNETAIASPSPQAFTPLSPDRVTQPIAPSEDISPPDSITNITKIPAEAHPTSTNSLSDISEIPQSILTNPDIQQFTANFLEDSSPVAKSDRFTPADSATAPSSDAFTNSSQQSLSESFSESSPTPFTAPTISTWNALSSYDSTPNGRRDAKNSASNNSSPVPSEISQSISEFSKHDIQEFAEDSPEDSPKNLPEDSPEALSDRPTPTEPSTAEFSQPFTDLPQLPKFVKNLSVLQPLTQQSPLTEHCEEIPDDEQPQQLKTPPFTNSSPIPSSPPTPNPKPQTQTTSPAPSKPHPGTTPPTWTNLTELITPQPPPAPTTNHYAPLPIQAKLSTSIIQRAPDPAPPIAVPPAPMTTVSIDDFKSPADLDSLLEPLAQEIYALLRHRFEIDRERYGGGKGRMPW